jgi:3-(3-hydroxy-phenyl)propionate hydroxylase
LLDMLGGSFVLLAFAATEGQVAALHESANVDGYVRLLVVGPGGIRDARGLAAKRYGANDGALYLIRPDQYVAARWRKPDRAAITAALHRALGR